MFDIVIRGGLVIDGTGAAGKRRDIGITADRVTSVGDLREAEGALSLDAIGKVVAPGFVDPHSHSDWTLQANRDADSTIRQGVTTEVVGNCGISNAPISEASEGAVASRLGSYGYPEHRRGGRSRSTCPRCPHWGRHRTSPSLWGTARFALPLASGPGTQARTKWTRWQSMSRRP